MGNKEVVKAIAEDRALRLTLRISRNLLSSAIVGLQDLKSLALTVSRDNVEAPDEILEWWDLVEIRTTNALESLGQVAKQMNPEPELLDLPLFVEGEGLRCREDYVMQNGSKSFVKGNDYTIKMVLGHEEYILVNQRGDDHTLTEEDIAKHFVPMAVVEYEQNERDKEI